MEMNLDKQKETKEELKEVKLRFYQKPTSGCYVKARHVLAGMGFLVIFNIYVLRTILSVAIVAMVNSTEETGNLSDTCPDRGQVIENQTNSNGIFDWDSANQGLLLGCYYYGYVISNVPGAWLAKRYGFKLVIGVSMLVSAILTLATPLAAYASFELLVALQIFLGLIQGVASPSMQGAWSFWSPPKEKSTLSSAAMSGSSFGACVTLPIGIVAELLGWEAVFYVTGGYVLLWTFVWFVLIYNRPNDHPRISKEERLYINESIGLEREKEETAKVRTPWRGMFTSVPLWAINIAHFCGNWGNYTLLTMLPTFLSTILKFDLSLIGGLTALPFLLQWIFTLISGYLTDFFIRRLILSTIAVRKLNTIIGLGVPGICIILAGYVGCNAAAVIVFLALSVAFNAFATPGCKLNVLDIAPKYCGITYAISNAIANTTGFLAPQVVGLILLNGNNLGQWQLVFWISSAFYFLGILIYLPFASAKEQSWAKGEIVRTKDGVEVEVLMKDLPSVSAQQNRMQL
ncbi:sialin-like isoform X2 [Clavelina lepadiformis]|uniref:sialin-like isoform X2 n=1 Tax=Clavelina lepadiformis TaxID=159417 RepID=UPI0040421610